MMKLPFSFITLLSLLSLSRILLSGHAFEVCVSKDKSCPNTQSCQSVENGTCTPLNHEDGSPHVGAFKINCYENGTATLRHFGFDNCDAFLGLKFRGEGNCFSLTVTPFSPIQGPSLLIKCPQPGTDNTTNPEDPQDSGENPPDSEDTPDNGSGKSDGENVFPPPTDQACFPSHAQVQLLDGRFKAMEALQIGDIVRVSPTQFSPVFFFGHRNPNALSTFVTIYTDNKERSTPLMASGDHFLYVNGNRLPAKLVKVGDVMYSSNGVPATVTRIEYVIAKGLYNPHTVYGDIMVDDLQASCFTNHVPYMLAQILLWPLRVSYQVLRFQPFDGFLDYGISMKIPF